MDPNGATVSSQVPSPCVSEFEAYLEKVDVERRNVPKDGAVRKGRPRTISNDEFWERVLQSEKQRFENDYKSRTVSVEDIMVGAKRRPSTTQA